MLDALRPSLLLDVADRAGTDKGSAPGDLGHPHRYAPIYERFMGPVRHQPVHLLEIGVHKGASLRMWEDFLPNARIVGVDINPAASAAAGARSTVVIGDATDRTFVRDVVAEHLAGVVDIVVDDGSHRFDQQIAVFEHLFPLLGEGGLYFVEDIVCSRFAPWNERGRGFADFYEFATHLAEQLTYFGDDPFEPYHSITDPRGLATPPSRTAWNEWLHEVSLFHNMAVFTKARRVFPYDPPGPEAATAPAEPSPEIPEGSLRGRGDATTFAARRRAAQAVVPFQPVAVAAPGAERRWTPDRVRPIPPLPRSPLPRLLVKMKRSAVKRAAPVLRDRARRTLEKLPLSQRGRRRWWGRLRRLLDIGEGAMPPGVVLGQRYDLVVLSNIGLTGQSLHRPHHVARQHARNGHRVFYVLAAPVLGATDPRPYVLRELEPNLYQVTLRTIGFDHYGGAIAGAALAGFRDAIAELVTEFRIGPAVVHVHLPSWTRLAFALRDRFLWPVIYDCMDEWDGFPHIGAEQVALEPELLAGADAVAFTAAPLLQRKGGTAKRPVLIRNGVEFEVFEQRCRPNTRFSFGKPTIGYYGTLAEWIDFDVLAGLADRRPDWTLVIAGRAFVDDLGGLERRRNVVLLGELPYEAMPELLWHFDVALIPFRVDEMTNAVNPVKLHEYLAGGKPVVATPIRELLDYGDMIRFGDGPESFETAIAELLESRNDEAAEARRRVARTNTWAERYRSFDALAVDLLPSVSVVVVTFDNLALSRQCLDSVLTRTLLPRLEVIVVDNASTDGTPDYLRDLAARDPRVRIVLNGENRGFAAANNQGLASATGSVLVLLNNDVVVPRGWMRGLLRALQDPEVGFVGPVSNSVGNEAWIPVDYRSVREMEDFANRHMNRHVGACFDIPMLAMYCAAMRRDAWEAVGPLDEGFAIGMFEDDDYAMRMRQAGYRVVCAPESFVHHYGMAAFQKLLAGGEYDRLWKRNQSYFESKWGSWVPHKKII